MGREIPLCHSREVIAALERAGFSRDRQRGSHVIMVRRSADGTTRTVPVPHPRNPLPRGTLRSVLAKAGLSIKEFAELLR